MDEWFQHPAGETLVFFLRLLPFLRAAVSIPAGLANMDARKFTLYSAAGSALFNAALAYSAYAARAKPDVLIEIRVVFAYAVSRWPFFLVLVVIALVAAFLLYRRRRVYRHAPEIAVRHVLRTSAIAAIAAGVILLGFSLLAPDATYRAVTWVAVDTGNVARQYGVSALLFLLAYAIGAITIGMIGLTISPALERLTRTVADCFRRRRKDVSR
jgi:hypothetical protein